MSGTEGKVVVITGASSGIGEATALLLAERGAKVVLGARGLDRLKALAARIAGAGGEAAYARTDVKRRDDLTALVKLACERYGKLDVLFSNAGIMPISPLDDLRVEDWEEMIDINIKGVLYGIATALPVFRKQGFGPFVNTASTAQTGKQKQKTKSWNPPISESSETHCSQWPWSPPSGGFWPIDRRR